MAYTGCVFDYCCQQIHGIWFYDDSDLHHLAGLLQKILNQLPKPDEGLPLASPAAAQQQQHQPAPVAAVQEPASLAAQPAAAADGDAFWDRSVHVTEDTLPASQHLVPNSSLLTESSAGAVSAKSPGV